MKYCDINNPLANERQIDQVHTTRSHAFFHLLTPPSASKPCDNSQLELRSLYTQYSIVCSKIIAKKDISRPRNKLFDRRQKRYKFKLFSMISLISWKSQVRFRNLFESWFSRGNYLEFLTFVQGISPPSVPFHPLKFYTWSQDHGGQNRKGIEKNANNRKCDFHAMKKRGGKQLLFKNVVPRSYPSRKVR